jgi:hypothetical protein
MIHPPKNQKGIVVVTCLFLLLTLSVIGAAAINTTVTDTRISATVRDIKQSHFLAEAGIAHATGFLMENLSQWESYETSQTLIHETNLGGGHYEVTIEDGGGDLRRRILCTASTGTGAKTQIEAILIPEYAPQAAPGLFGCEGLELDESVTTQSYSSSGGAAAGENGHAGTSDANSEVILLGSVAIDGDVLAAGRLGMEGDARLLGTGYANGGISLLGNAAISDDAKTGGRCSGCDGRVGGSIEEYVSPPPLEVTPCDPLDIDGLFALEAQPIAGNSDNGELASPCYDAASGEFLAGSGDTCTLGATGEQKQYFFSRLVLDGDARLTLRGDVSLYVDGDFLVLGHSIVDFSVGTKLTLYVTGEFFCDEAGQVNNGGRPQDLRIFSDYPSLDTGDFKVRLHSGTDLTAVVYSPKTAIEIHSNAGLFGAIRGKYVSMGSSAAFWYDEDLAESDAGLQEVSGFEVALKRRLD